MNGLYRGVLVRLLDEGIGISQRETMVLGKYEDIVDRLHAARREMEALDEREGHGAGEAA